MSLLKLFLMFIAAGFFVTSSVNATHADSRVIESFSDYKVGKFPKRLRTYPFQRGKAQEVYVVAEEGGNKFLRAKDDKNLSVQVMRQFLWDVKKHPWISWKWRARTLPKGADERDFKNTNDSACGIYIVFGKYSGKALKYTWSTSVPVGTVIRKKPNKFHMIIKNSGPPADPGAWQTVSVNIPEDYKANFGEEIQKSPTGFGILTDGNADKVRAPSACDYDAFTVSSGPSA